MNIGSPTQKTDFTLDVFGRYICNTFEELLASSDSTFRANAKDINGNPLPQRGDVRPFDYIVIGGGTFGSPLAEHIWNRTSGRSERVLVLEGGPFALPEHVQNLPMMQTGEVWGLPWNSDQPNLQFQGLAYCLGGRSVFWGGWSPRLVAAAARLGVVIGRTTKMPCGCEMTKDMGVNTWAAFAGADDNALVDGDFAVLEDELQPVLKSLRHDGINIVAIHSHMTQENPRILFLHYWGRGKVADLAESLKTALAKQSK